MADLLITGISGYIGQAVARLALARGHRVGGTYLNHRPDSLAAAGCELVRAAIEDLPALIDAARPDVVLHTAAAWSTEAEAQAAIVEGTRGVAAGLPAGGQPADPHVDRPGVRRRAPALSRETIRPRR